MKIKKFEYKIVNSTNNTALRLIKRTNCQFGMVTAISQKLGKGQYGKKWISYKGNLFASFFFKIQNQNLNFKKITQLNCELIRKLLSSFYKKKITIKPPNDLLINGKKICGILQESIIKDEKQYLIIGVGINLIKSPYIKGYPTTNLFELIKKKIDKNKFQNKLKSIFEKNLNRIIK
jgi:BirA family biotin operon repressor/biotin-[acetyl-CoA-carboxylase] ligase